MYGRILGLLEGRDVVDMCFASKTTESSVRWDSRGMYRRSMNCLHESKRWMMDDLDARLRVHQQKSNTWVVRNEAAASAIADISNSTIVSNRGPYYVPWTVVKCAYAEQSVKRLNSASSSR